MSYGKIGKFYEKHVSVKPKIVIVPPYIIEEARKIAEKLGIEV
jgi:hypothetical protein